MTTTPPLKKFLKQLPTLPGVYQMIDIHDTVLYVGKASNLKNRINSYFIKNQPSPKTRSLVSQIHRIDISITRSETEALLLESNLIKSLRPKYNVLMRDDKSYPFIEITQHAFPRVHVFRSKRKPSKGEFYGPFPNAYAVRESLQFIQKVFLLRNCRDTYFSARLRPCLQYQIKRCTAPCTDYISQEDYAKAVQSARLFLQGKSDDLLNALKAEMDEASNALQFEQAARLRDQIQHLRHLQSTQGMVHLRGDADIIAIHEAPVMPMVQWVSVRNGEVLATRTYTPTVPKESDDDNRWQDILHAFMGYYYLEQPEHIPALIILEREPDDAIAMETLLTQLRGSRTRLQWRVNKEKARWLDFCQQNLNVNLKQKLQAKSSQEQRLMALAELLNIKDIQRIECFDISHTQGEATVASCVVFDEHGPKNSLYRQYNITDITKGDDYAAMGKALRRRFKPSSSRVLPDILLIDGGKGQVNIASEVLKELDITSVLLLGLAKGKDRKAGYERLVRSDTLEEQRLPEDHKAFHLLQHIRDEAHRFAIGAHRQKRAKARTVSVLDELQGIGAVRKKALLQHFGGLVALRKASIEEIASVPGISYKLAERIFNQLN